MYMYSIQLIRSLMKSSLSKLDLRLLSMYMYMCDLRRLERIFRCCSVCEMMVDYKEGYLMVWTNYISPDNSIVGLYFKATCYVISVTMATLKVHKGVL